MESISRVRAFSSPELAPSSTSPAIRPEDYSLEGIATNVKLLLKLIQEHNGASTNDDRKTQRIAGMITILDDVKSRIEKSQSAKKRLAELRRCNTELRPSRTPNTPREKKPQESVTDDNEKLRKQLSASLAARKSLEIMCSSLGKEKEIMAREVARKVGELNGMEELVNDLKAQNETLLSKLQSHAAEQKEKRSSMGADVQGNAALQDRNKALSDQLLKSLDSYRSLKKKYKDAKQENFRIRTTMEEFGVEVRAGLEQIRSFRQRMDSRKDQSPDIEKEISALERMFELINKKICKHEENNTECAKPKAEISASKPSVLA